VKNSWLKQETKPVHTIGRKKQNVTDKREQSKGDRETVKHMFWIL
jgi:hypothetical protein